MKAKTWRFAGGYAPPGAVRGREAHQAPATRSLSGGGRDAFCDARTKSASYHHIGANVHKRKIEMPCRPAHFTGRHAAAMSMPALSWSFLIWETMTAILFHLFAAFSQCGQCAIRPVGNSVLIRVWVGQLRSVDPLSYSLFAQHA